jgi:hypothetical protein
MSAMDEQLRHLPDKTAALIRGAATAVGTAAGGGLKAAVLIGAAVHPDRPDRARHPELLLVVESLPLAAMTKLAEAMHPYTRKGLRFRTVTTEELRGSLDVYALEFAEWAVHHILLSGDDPLTGLAPKPAHLRHEIERSVRGINRRVRNRVLQGMAAQARGGDLDRVFDDALTHLLIAAHHTLVLVGDSPPLGERKLLEAFVGWLELDGAGALALLGRLRAGEKRRDTLAELECLTRILAAACRKIDALEVST